MYTKLAFIRSVYVFDFLPINIHFTEKIRQYKLLLVKTFEHFIRIFCVCNMYRLRIKCVYLFDVYIVCIHSFVFSYVLFCFLLISRNRRHLPPMMSIVLRAHASFYLNPNYEMKTFLAFFFLLVPSYIFPK